jgi:hypothetical protein
VSVKDLIARARAEITSTKRCRNRVSEGRCELREHKSGGHTCHLGSGGLVSWPEGARGSSLTAPDPPILLEELCDALEHAIRENTCDVCAGTGKPDTGIPCMCLGTGKMSEAVPVLREALVSASIARST